MNIFVRHGSENSACNFICCVFFLHSRLIYEPTLQAFWQCTHTLRNVQINLIAKETSVFSDVLCCDIIVTWSSLFDLARLTSYYYYQHARSIAYVAFSRKATNFTSNPLNLPLVLAHCRVFCPYIGVIFPESDTLTRGEKGGLFMLSAAQMYDEVYFNFGL